MQLRYTCIVLDHDDTSVESTAVVHHPAHVEVMKRLRPGMDPVDLDTWFRKNFHPGIMAYLSEELGFNEEELALEYRIWRKHTTGSIPPFFPGFLPLLAEFRRRGGIVTVVSHSEEDVIKGHYRANREVPGFEPDLIFGWIDDKQKRKPSVWPIEQIRKRYALESSDILVIDDLKPGAIMAQTAGVDFAAAGWGHDIPEIRAYMQRHSVAYFHSVQEFSRFLLDGAGIDSAS